ncbi:hypothetical protein BH11PLA2_BH11PLA2_30800 [soil metagenome]
MFRTFVGAAIGCTLGVLALGAWGFSDGYTLGVKSAQLPPGMAAGANYAFFYIMYLWPMAAAIGGGGGAIAGFGSWLVRPRKPQTVAA